MDSVLRKMLEENGNLKEYEAMDSVVDDLMDSDFPVMVLTHIFEMLSNGEGDSIDVVLNMFIDNMCDSLSQHLLISLPYVFKDIKHLWKYGDEQTKRCIMLLLVYIHEDFIKKRKSFSNEGIEEIRRTAKRYGDENGKN